MSYFEDTYKINSESKTDDKYIYTNNNVRISVLTSRLIRVESQSDAKFCDLPTQAVLNRDMMNGEVIFTEDETIITVKTSDVTFNVNATSGKMKSIVLKDNTKVSNYKTGNLGGTRRTLDMTFGKVSIGNGIISRNGVGVMDDSTSLIICSDALVRSRNEVLNREKNGTDKYYFAYGNDYKAAVADYFKLTGSAPLIPRYALGNWWSRYKAYTQDEYLQLMNRFRVEKIPITVATVDMDWHWTDVVNEFGFKAGEYKKPKGLISKLTGCYTIPGWTGFSWNTKLFPYYHKFLDTLHDNNLKVTLNVHPAVGVRYFEDMYKDFAELMGVNPETKQQIEFDITDKKFIEAYFKLIFHKYEDDGVDFWWLDWQQGNKTKVKGLDPLWALNHYHSLDSERGGKRPLILSRFAGYGSHRYPLGFSGDTAVNWNCLKFQPYFTSTASNIGYTWWSHDIGGHHFGRRDDELYIRWLQYGVFSPIMRLHSANNEFLGKEPWKFRHEVEATAKEIMRFRHRMIPYIYTMNRLTQEDGLPLCKPMYYDYPKEDEAYRVNNEYMFGTELVVSPITEKTSSKTNMSSCEVWLPKGRYTDIFTGRIYSGDSKFRMYRDTSSIPALAREGAIIPLSSDGNSNNWDNPDDMELLIYRGNGSFNLYEDDGETQEYKNGAFAQTLFEQRDLDGNILFTVNSVQGDLLQIPEKRNYTFSFRDIASTEKLAVLIDSEPCDFTANVENGFVSVSVEDVKTDKKINVILKRYCARKNPPKPQLIAEFLSKVQGSNDLKALRYTKCLNSDFNGKLLAPKEIKSAINEIMHMQ